MKKKSMNASRRARVGAARIETCKCVRGQRYPALASCGCYTSTLSHRHLLNLEWLAKYPSVWRGYRLTKSVLRNIFHMMQACGLYSYHTALADATAVIRNNINRLKRCSTALSGAERKL